MMEYKQMPADLFKRYNADPRGMDAEVRRLMKVLEDKYYSVSVWPEHLAGRLYSNSKLNRTVQAVKISKSNQPSQ